MADRVNKETRLFVEKVLDYEYLEHLIDFEPQTEADLKAKIRKIVDEEFDDAYYFMEKSSSFLSKIIEDGISKVDVDAAIDLAAENLRREYPRDYPSVIEDEGWPMEWQNDPKPRRRPQKKPATKQPTGKESSKTKGKTKRKITTVKAVAAPLPKTKKSKGGK